MYLRPLVPSCMTQEHVRVLHERALRILDEVGLRVTDVRLVERLKGKRGVRFAGDRVTFDPAVIDELVNVQGRQDTPMPRQPPVPERITIVTSYHAGYIADADTGERRPLTESDVIEMARLSDALRDRDVLGGAPGAPQDLPPGLRSVAQYKISLEWSRSGHYAPVSSVREYRYIRAMAKAMGNEFHMECYLISPLRMEGNEVTAVLDYLETCGPEDKPVPVGVNAMPTMGLSAPVDPLSIFALGIAENMGGFAALRLAYEEDINVQMSRPNAYPCDFRTGCLVVGSPEAVLIEVVRRDIDRFYRCRSWARALRTMSCSAGIQSAVEKTAGAITSALAGYHEWFGGGLIGLDEVFSPVQLLIDCEIRDYALQVAKGFEVDEDFDDVALLKDILQNSEDALPFMTHPTTVDNYRKVYRAPHLFDRSMSKADSASGKAILDKVREEIEHLIASHEYRLEDDRLREIENIYARAQKEFE